MNPTEIQPVTSMFQSLVLPPYRVNTSFTINQSEQKIVDDALKDRIVEFESGSAILTPTGTKILDEMVVALNKVQDKNVKIIGHTDSSGDAKKECGIELGTCRSSQNVSNSERDCCRTFKYGWIGFRETCRG